MTATQRVHQLIQGLLLLGLISFSACKQDSSNLPAPVQELIKTYEKDKTAKNGQKLLAGIFAEAQNEESASEELLQTGIRYADDLQNNNFKAAALHSLVRDYFDSPKTPKRLEQLIDITQNAFHKAQAALALKRGYVLSFPDAEQSQNYEKSIPAYAQNIDSFMSYIGRQIIDPKTKNFSPEMAREYVNVAEGIALSYPAYERNPHYLFNAAKTANTIRDYAKSISLYNWILDKYPDDPLAAKSLFMMAFTYDSPPLNQEDAAKKYYEEFLEKYPKDELADDAKFLLDNIGVSEDELLKRIQEKQKKE